MNSSAYRNNSIPATTGLAEFAIVPAACNTGGQSSSSRNNVVFLSNVRQPQPSPAPAANDPIGPLLDECISEMRDILLRMQTYRTLSKSRDKSTR